MRTLQEILRKTNYKENQIEYFLTECFADYLYFAEHVLGFELADYHREWYDLFEKFPRICLIAFRGSGKTCFISGYLLWLAMFKENLNFLIISNTFEQSKMVLKLIRKTITDNEFLREFMPTGRDAIWKATELTLTTGCNFYCRTYGEAVKGLRIDYLFPDEMGLYEDKSVYWTAISPVVQLNRGRIIGAGTPVSNGDLLAELKENEEYFVQEYPSEKEGKVLWGNKYTLLEHDTETQRSLLAIKKEIGDLAYTQEYLLIPISSANSLFPYELCSQALSNDKFLPYGKTTEKYYLGYDVAISPKGDWTVMTVLGVNADRKMIVRALRFRDNFEEQKRRVRQLMGDFPITKGFIDATALGDQQAKEIHEEFPQVEPKKMTYDEKYSMLIDLRNDFDNYKIVIPNNKEDINAYSYAEELLRELNDFALKIDLRPGQTSRPKFHKGKYDDCLLEGTLITTNKGQKPIEEIRVGDFVLTRKGFRPVTKAWLKSDNSPLYELKFSDGRTLIGTSDHKIYTKEKGFVPMDTMRNTYKPLDAISIWEEKEKKPQLNSGVKPLIKIKGQDIGVGQVDMDSYTEMFGSFITAKYHKDLSYTTKMKINQIITTIILNASREKNIPQSTNGLKKDMKNKKNIFQKLGNLLTNGIWQKKEGLGTKSTSTIVLEKLGKTSALKKRIVNYVEKNLKIILSSSQENIVQTDANKKHIELETQRELDYRGKVYDLTIEDEHEFFANGILVHNCVDSLALANKASQEMYGGISIRGIEY